MRTAAGRWRRGAAAAFLLVSAAAPFVGSTARAAGYFPDSHLLFRRLLADPRQAQTSARYYRLAGRDTADVALGNTWGMRRWRWGRDGSWEGQWDIEGMGYSRFLLSGSINEFQTIDFFANLPLELRRRAFSARLTLFHESSHLGDDYFRRTGDAGSRYSVEGARAVASYDLGPALRVYGGGSQLLHAIPGPRGLTAQAGFEATTRDLHWLRHPCWMYLAQDVQSRGTRRWDVDSSTQVGLRVGFPGVVHSLRVHGGYYSGHSSFEQFRARRESFFSLGASFDF